MSQTAKSFPSSRSAPGGSADHRLIYAPANNL